MRDNLIKQTHQRAKFQILRAPLTPLTSGQRCFLKALLLSYDHLVTVENPENLALAADPLIIALNHNGSLETILVPVYLIYLRQGRLFSAVSDWMFGRLPFAGWLFRQIDPVYVYNKPSTLSFLNKHRKKPSDSVITESVKRLVRGRSIMIFPEGTRNLNSRTLLRGRPGIGHMALASQRPVVPVGASFAPRMPQVVSVGSSREIEKATRAGARNYRSLHIRIGAPMTFADEIAEFQRIRSDSEPRHNAAKIKSLLSYQDPGF